MAFLAAAVYLNRYHKIIHFTLSEFSFDYEIFHTCIRIGLPTGIQQTFVSLGMMALMSIVNTFGTNVIAAYSGAVRIDSLAMMPAMNFSAALATFVGQNLGAKKTERVKSGLRATLLMSSGFSILITIIVVLFKKFLMGLFTNDPEVIKIGSEYLVIVCSFYLLFTVMFSVNGVLRGAGDTLIPMFISLFSLWIIRLPFAWFFSSQIGESGIWWSTPASWVIGLTLYYLYYSTGKWKNKVVVRHSMINSG